MSPHNWDEVAELWVEQRPQTLWRRHSDAVNRRLVAAWLPAGSRRALKTDLFDEAVGAGLYGCLARRSAEVVGIDRSPPVVRAARRRYPALIAVEADVRELPFATGYFDAVVSNSTLDHFDSKAEIRTALAELARVLAPGGRLLVTLDNPANPLVRLAKALPRERLNRLWFRHAGASARLGLAPYYVGETLAARELCRSLAALGFEVEAATTAVHVPRPLAVLVAGVLERRARPATQERFLDLLLRCEALGAWPTGSLTGFFTAMLARRL